MCPQNKNNPEGNSAPQQMIPDPLGDESDFFDQVKENIKNIN